MTIINIPDKSQAYISLINFIEDFFIFKSRQPYVYKYLIEADKISIK